MKSVFAFMATAAMACALCAAQNAPSSSATQTPDQNPATTQPTQQPATMQPGTTPPTEPQTSAPSPAATAPAPAAQPSATAAGTPPQPSTPRVAAGSVIPVELTKTVDAKKAKQGDEVVARVTQDLKTTSGEVMVSKDTTVIGHVTQAQARNKEQKESELGITFDHAKTKTGEMQLPMSIQAVIAPQNNSNSNNAEGYGGAAPSAGSPSASSMGGGRSSMGTGAAQPPQAAAAPSASGGDSQPANGSLPQINGNTQGVIGIPNLKLEANAQASAQGSVLTSDKGNVKLESGTLLLLRVNQ